MKFFMKHLKFILTIVLILIIVSGFTLWNPYRDRSVVKTNFMLDTLITIKATGNNASEAIDAAMERIREIENTMSAHLEGSEIWNINQKGYKQDVPVSRDTLAVIQRAIHYSRLTDGYFDISVKPLVDLWQIGTEHPRVPEEQEIEAALDKIDYRQIIVDENSQTVRMAQQGMGIDLGGIAKGYAADEAVRVLKEYGIESAYADLGGNLIVLGQKKNKIGWMQHLLSKIKGRKIDLYDDWRIGIQNPFEGRGLHMAAVEIANQCVVTSGPYERNFEVDGKLYHHILDPYTGYPAERGLISATIISEKSIDADALSTSLYLLGEERGLALIETLPGIEAITINHDMEVRVTSGLKGKINIVDKEFKLVD